MNPKTDAELVEFVKQGELRELDEVALCILTAWVSGRHGYGVGPDAVENAYDIAIKVMKKRHEIRKTVGQIAAEDLTTLFDGGKL